MVYGPPGSGKSTWVLLFVNYLASVYGKVLYNSHEEKLNKTLQDRVRDYLPNGSHPKLYFAPAWPFDYLMAKIKTNKYRVIVIDSVQYMNFSYEQLKQLRDVYKKRQIILVLVSFGTDLNKPVGDTKLLHASDVKIYINDGKLYSKARGKKGYKTTLFKVAEAVESKTLFEQEAKTEVV